MEAQLRQIRGHTFLNCLADPPSLVDLGANVGKFAAEFLASYPSARVVLVEGDPYLNDVLKGTFRDTPNVQLYQGLVGPESKSNASFFLSEIPEGNSVVRRFCELWGTQPAREIQVEMISLQNLLELAGIERVDLLKVDIEGSEWDLLEGFSVELAAAVDQLSVEFHDFLDPTQRARTERCIARLERLGYAALCRGADHGHGSPYFDCLFHRAR
jgi:FkbM family methyltransferase